MNLAIQNKMNLAIQKQNPVYAARILVINFSITSACISFILPINNTFATRPALH